MTDPPPPAEQLHAVVIGADRVFGREIVAHLRAEGILVADRMEALHAGAPLNMLVVNMTVPSPDIRFGSVTDDELRAILDEQLVAFVATVQRALPLLAPNAAIVQVVSRAHLGAWGGVHVAASAAACIAMARSMAIELAPEGIRVNCVATAPAGGPEDSPVCRADLAATVAWLGGGGSGHITGETILVDRGASLQMAQAARR